MTYAFPEYAGIFERSTGVAVPLPTELCVLGLLVVCEFWLLVSNDVGLLVADDTGVVCVDEDGASELCVSED